MTHECPVPICAHLRRSESSPMAIPMTCGCGRCQRPTSRQGPLGRPDGSVAYLPTCVNSTTLTNYICVQDLLVKLPRLIKIGSLEWEAPLPPDNHPATTRSPPFPAVSFRVSGSSLGSLGTGQCDRSERCSAVGPVERSLFSRCSGRFRA